MISTSEWVDAYNSHQSTSSTSISNDYWIPSSGYPYYNTPQTISPHTISTTTKMVPQRCKVCDGIGIRIKPFEPGVLEIVPEDEADMQEYIICEPCGGQGWVSLLETTMTTMTNS
jgi:hypothetical protein